MKRGPENRISQEPLTSAVNAVYGVYERHFINPESYLIESSPYDDLAETARRYPIFESPIQDLNEGLQIAEDIRSAYGHSFNGAGLAFEWDIDQHARKLLADIMLSRTSISRNRLRQAGVFDEAGAIMNEVSQLGSVLKLSADRVIASVLNGDLRVTPLEPTSR